MGAWAYHDPDDWPACGLTIRTADGEGAECVIAANHDGYHEDAERSHRPPGWRDEP